MRRPEAENRESRRRITRRALVMGGAMAAVTGVLTLRMHRLQVREAERYLLLAEENRINIRLIPPARGLIFDRAGVVLADNQRNHRVVMVREDAGDPEAVLDRLARIIPIAAEDQSRLLREMYRRSAFVPVTVAERLSWEEMAAIAVNAPALPGVTPEIGLTRAYPLEADFAHVVGYVGPVSDYDLQRLDDPDPLLQIPDFQIGKYAVEAKMEAPLRGRAGARRVEVNAAGRVIRELDRQEGEAGADIQLTVDHQLQNFVQARLAGESAAAVVMEIATGDIRALGSAPGFDPNVRQRHLGVRLQRAAEQRTPTAGLQVGAWRLSARLDLQDGGGAGRAGGRRGPPGRDGVLSRPLRAWRPPLSLLAARRAWPDRPAQQPQAILRRLLLRRRPAGRDRRDRGDGAQAGAGRAL
jgi:penicillin-binding protein 2